jgi:hypothetical protein
VVFEKYVRRSGNSSKTVELRVMISHG